jgi:hypothetical protein
MAWANKIKNVSKEKRSGASEVCAIIHCVIFPNKIPSFLSTTGSVGARKSGSFTTTAKISKRTGV